MDLELSDKHVLITGASRGIGLACARAFVQEGARVSLVSRSEEHLILATQELMRITPSPGGRVFHCSADLRSSEAALKALDAAEGHFGAVDVLVNSAGAAQRTPHESLTADAWHAAMEAKFFTYIHMMDLVVKRMASIGRGSIVNVVGVGGKVASPVHLPGGAANAALMLASAGLAAAYGPKGVRVNAVNPGPTFTDRLKGRMEALAQSQGITVEQAIEQATKVIPLGRFAQPTEIADAVLFLASARASYITGAALGMDGATTPMVV
jgi:NAD(P)-dependent dehydrogenase (short-subunit alcohol dehydrogenase family)